MNCGSSICSQTPPSEKQHELKLCPHFIKEVASLCFFFTIAGMSPSLPRSSVQTQPPYSRVETHSRCVTSRSLLGSRTGAKKKKQRTLPPRTDVRTVQWLPPLLCKHHSFLNGSRTQGASTFQRLHFRSCVKIPIIRLPQ